MRRYFVRLPDGTAKQVENKNDAYQRMTNGTAIDWWVEPASDYDPVDDFARIGTVRCDDCGARVRPRSLESLPPHGCVQRQQANRAASQGEEG